MLYKYKATTSDGKPSDGTIDAATVDIAINSLQRRGLIVVSVEPAGKNQSIWEYNITLFSAVSQNDVVVLSRQLATLFEAKVSLLDALKILASESENEAIRDILTQMIDDIQGGVTISAAMAKHPKAFSLFYVNMIKAGEETGKLSEVLSYLADYLERTYELQSKVKNALVYPAFVIVSFVIVMIIMLTVVIPQLATILGDSGQELPVITKLIIGVSNIFLNYGIIIAILFVFAILAYVRYQRTPAGRLVIGRFKLSIPYIGTMYRKLFLARIADNMDTMLSSGISMVRAIEITGDIVENDIYKGIMRDVMDGVKSGSSFSDALSRHDEIPRIVIQMTRVGEETGKLAYVLKTLGRFYKRETTTAIDTIVSLIEPAMIVALGLGVGFLLVGVLGPIYNISGTI